MSPTNHQTLPKATASRSKQELTRKQQQSSIQKLEPFFQPLPFTSSTKRQSELKDVLRILNQQSINIPVLLVKKYEDALPILSLFQQTQKQILLKLISPKTFSINNTESSAKEDDDNGSFFETNSLRSKMSRLESALRKHGSIYPVFIKLKQLKDFHTRFFDKKSIWVITEKELPQLQKQISKAETDNNGLEDQKSPYERSNFAKCCIKPIAPMTREESQNYLLFYLDKMAKHSACTCSKSDLLFLFNETFESVPHELLFTKAFEIFEKAMSYAPKHLTRNILKQAVVDVLKPQNKARQILYLQKKQEQLKQKIFGQDAAIAQAYEAIVPFYINENKQQPAVLAFFGPSGVGKTALAQEISLALTGHEAVLLHMEAYNDEMKMSNLIGSANGYVNSNDDGILAQHIKQNPNAIVLLDEFEKAHKSIQKMFLGIFDKGIITDSHSGNIDCKNTIFILTSNAGITEKKQISLGSQGASQYEIDETALRKQFAPELLGRINTKIYFKPLNKEDKEKILQQRITLLNQNPMIKKRKIHITLSDEVCEELIALADEPSTGVRPLINAFSQKIEGYILVAVIKRDIQDHQTIRITSIKQPLTWEKLTTRVATHPLHALKEAQQITRNT